MALTVNAVQTEVVNLVGRLMDLVGNYAGVPQGGSPPTNPYVNAAMRDGLTRMGYPLSDPNGIQVVDVDLAAFDVRALRRLMEWTELWLIEQVERDWWRAEQYRTPGLALMPGPNNSIIDPLDGVLSKIRNRISQLKEIVSKTYYQSMNKNISLGLITIGSRFDPTIPLSISEIMPPWTGAPDGLWLYGCTAVEFWGWGGWNGGGPCV